ncbi:ABC transporter substrate-binding protein [Nesterenkonia jeotgali]|uniref:Peptide/nickel transport system substrate-binding protein n=1 Tax=Nesterenkonia jeotgali TaxID=317018 RepID=A0A839FZC2_9MICC|nr:ABC transporter substrate-binding protein [Nesterenkonia jeotgali]MBA8922414.1 peptide/nickel transport system substrate-binding protein [Nesterenkonia jeotgali]
MSQTPHLRLVRGPLLGLLPLSLLLTSCAAQGSTGENDGSPEAGGELVYLDAELSRDTQLQASGTWQDSAYITNITDRLIHKNPETGELEPYLAEAFDVSEDGLTYTFTIVEGVTHSDGTPLDVDNVKRNLQWQHDGDTEQAIPANNWFPAIAGIETDEAARTVTVELEEPYAPFLDVLSFWRTSIVADATIDAPIEEQQQLSGIIGSGPFSVESETYGEEITLTRREGYDWAPPSSEHQGEALLETITILPVTEDSVRLGSLRSGEADLIRYLQPSEEQGLLDAGIEIISEQGTGNSNVWDIRQSAPFVNDVDVRRALQSGIDREAIIDELYTESWRPAKSVVTEDTFGFIDKSESLAYDPERSAELLDGAGFEEFDEEGYRIDQDGERLSLVTYIDVFDATAGPLFQLIQLQLAEIGVELQIEETDYSSYSDVILDPEIAVRRNGWPEADPWVRQTVNYTVDESNALFLEEDDPAAQELGELYQDQLHQTGPAAREGVLAEIQDTLIDDAFLLPILDDSQVFGAQPHVQDLEFTSEARPVFYSTWIDD